MKQSKKIFTGKMVQDVSTRLLNDGDYTYGLNILTGIGTGSQNGAVTNMNGTEIVSFTLPDGVNKVIGTCRDFERNGIIYFVYNSLGDHSIYRYLVTEDTIETKVRWVGLNWNSSTKITGAGVIDHFLVWSDSSGKTRNVDLDRTYVFTSDPYSLTHSTYFSSDLFTLRINSIDVSSNFSTGDSITVSGSATPGNNGDYTVNDSTYYSGSTYITLSSGTYTLVGTESVTITNNSLTSPTDITENESKIAFHKYAPVLPPTVVKVDATADTNYIANKSLQFAYRYTYLDKVKTPLSPYSKLLPPEYDEIVDEKNNVTITIKPEVPTDELHSVEFFVREGNEAQWYRFFTQDDVTSNMAGDFLSQTYVGNETKIALSDDDSSTLFEAIPNQAGSLEVFKDRAFLTVKEDGFDQASPTFSAAENVVTVTNGNNRYFKEKGTYNVGVVYSNEYGKVSTVFSKKTVDISQQTLAVQDLKVLEEGGTVTTYSNVLCPSQSKSEIDWTITGTPPEWATKYHIVLSKELYYSIYAQVPANALFYIKDVNTSYSPLAYEVVINDRAYLKIRSDYATYQDKITYVHLQIPKNCPITPTKGMSLRLMNYDETYEILDVLDDLVVIAKDGGAFDWTAKTTALLIEIFLPSSSKDDVLYEIGDTYDISNPGESSRAHSTTAGTLSGDTYYVDGYTPSGETGRFFYEDRMYKFDTYVYEAIYDVTNWSSVWYKTPQIVESPTLTYSTQDTTSIEQSDIRTGFISFANVGGVSTLDYGRIASDWGRVNTVNNDASSVSKPTVIKYGDPYQLGTNDNGISRFNDLNEYILPTERGAITRLVKADDVNSNVLLAIHGRTISSMYVGETILKGSDGNDNLALSAKVIGYDRELSGKYGSIFTASIAENKGRVYGYDIYRGEIWRYSQNGVDPLGQLYGMSSYLKNVSTTLLSDIKAGTEVTVTGGYDAYNDLYICSFGGSVNETIAFREGPISERNGFMTFCSFSAEQYANIGDTFVGFLRGKLYKHNVGTPGFFYESGSVQTFDIRVWFYDANYIHVEPQNNTYFNNGDSITISGSNSNDGTYTVINVEDVYYLGYVEYVKVSLDQTLTAEFSKIVTITNSSLSYPNYSFKIRTAINADLSKVKLYENLSVESTIVPVTATLTTPEGQTTDVISTEFNTIENVHYSEIKRDKNSTVEAGQTALIHGRHMRSAVAEIELEYTSAVSLNAVNVGYIESSGHNT